MKELLHETAERAARYIEGLSDRSVNPASAALNSLEALGGRFPEEPAEPGEIVALLDDAGSPATVASAGRRYFGFVVGGTLPAALAANWMASAWDQNASLRVMSPVAARLEEIVQAWMLDVLGLPSKAGAGFVTGTTMANFAALAAARTALLQRAGWNVEEDGLFGAPPIKVVVGEEVHASLLKALSLLGMGRARLIRVPADLQGRLLADQLPRLDSQTLVCTQAGNVNTGAFDPTGEVCERAREAGAWVHVDGAFGLWAAASTHYAPLLAGAEAADSWAIDCHKWLNVPYDSAVAVVRQADYLRNAMAMTAAYLVPSGLREPAHYTPEISRRARGVELWAAMRSLGRRGLRDLIERNCRQAKLFAQRFEQSGFSVLNDVVLNQVLVSFGSKQETLRVIAEVQKDGTCWCGGTEFRGQAAMRISVSNWSTTDEDVEASVEAIIGIARRVRSSSRA